MIKLFRCLSLIISVAFFAGCNEEEIKPIEPTSITIEPPSVTMTAGETLQLSATVEPQNVTDKEVTWTSSNPSVASVSPSGMVSAVKKGETVVTALIGKCISVCNVHVVDKTIDVSAIELDITEYSVTEGESFSITATVSPADASDKTLEWSSNNVAVALVDQNGKVTAISEGKATIEVKAGGKVASCIVTVTPLPVQGSEENGHSYVDMGLPSGLKWATCNVGANAPEEFGDYFAWGETEPYYIPGHSQDDPCSNWKDGKSAGYHWASYRWRNDTYGSLTKYNTSGLHGTVDNKTTLEMADDAARQVLGGSWRMPTNDEWAELCTKCTWTWTTRNGINGRLVTGRNGSSIFLPASGRRQLINLYYVGSDGCYWSSSLKTEEQFDAWLMYFDSGDISRGNSGRYHGFSVRAVIGEGIKVAVTSVSLSKSSMTLMVGETAVLSAIVKPDDATYKTVTWTSSHLGIATVDAGGKVTAVREGTATITATVGEKSASCKVTVSKKVIAVTGVTLNKTSLALTEGDSETLTATVKPDDATDKTVTWTSSDVSIAKVDAGGKVTAVKEGTTTITAKASDKEATCQVTVKPEGTPSGGLEGTGEEDMN